jgi:hypothetical protein
MFGMSLHTLVIYFPFFAIIDFACHWIAPRSASYFIWLGRGLAAARLGDSEEPTAKRDHVVGRYLLRGLATYVTAFVFVPSLRDVTRAFDLSQRTAWIYKIIGNVFPTIFEEPAHIFSLGDPTGAYDMRHFITVCLVMSFITVVVYTGPGRQEFMRWGVLKPIKKSVKTKRPKMNNTKVFILGVVIFIVGAAILKLFSFYGSVDVGMKYSWDLGAFPPCLVFILGSWILSCGLGLVAASSDITIADNLFKMKQVSNG